MSPFARRSAWVLVGVTLAGCSAPPATGTGGQSVVKPPPPEDVDAGAAATPATTAPTPSMPPKAN